MPPWSQTRINPESNAIQQNAFLSVFRGSMGKVVDIQQRRIMFERNGLLCLEMFVSLCHLSGHAQADFGEALAVIDEADSQSILQYPSGIKDGYFRIYRSILCRQRRHSYLGYLSPLFFEKKNVALTVHFFVGSSV